MNKKYENYRGCKWCVIPFDGLFSVQAYDEDGDLIGRVVVENKADTAGAAHDLIDYWLVIADANYENGYVVTTGDLEGYE